MFTSVKTQTVWYLLDGFHRIEACKKNGKTHITANVVPITNEDDAVWWAAAANQSHGLRRSNADKLRALELVLSLDSSLELSDREIARRIGVSHTFVSVNRSKAGLKEKSRKRRAERAFHLSYLIPQVPQKVGD